MASTTYTLTPTWDASNRYTAATDIEVLVSAPGVYGVTWSITADDTAPTIDEVRGNPVRSGQSFPVGLTAGDRLWLAGNGGAAGSAIANLEA